MIKSRFIRFLLCALCFSLFGPGSMLHAAPPASKPNIVLFVVDDMGLMDTSVPFLTDEKGVPKKHPLNNFYRTPNMERLAKQGVRFSEFYAMSVCSPTRVSIMTGQTSARHHTTQFIKPESNNAGAFGAQDWQWKGIAEGDVTLPAVLRNRGYRTIHSGKAHFGPNDSFGADPSNFGFDVNIAGCAYGQPGSYYGQENYGWGKKGREKRAVPGLENYHGTDTHLTDACTIEMNAAISNAVKEKKPFFAYMAHYAVHTPFQTDPRFADNYKGEKKKGLAAFATLIEGMDKSLGDILDQIEELGVAEDTLIFFVGDNGSDAPVGGTHDIASAAPLRGKKATHYEGGMRVPFIAAWANPNSKNPHQMRVPIPAGRVNPDVFGTVYDFFPTILGVTGTPAPDGIILDGMDLRSTLSGERKKDLNERGFLMHFPHQHRSSYFTAFRKGDWKIVYHYKPGPKNKGDRIELFNLASDPYESKNLATTNPVELKSMMTAMTGALEEAEAQYPLASDKKTPLKPALD